MRLFFLVFTILACSSVRAEKAPSIISRIANTPGNLIIFSHQEEALFTIPDLPTNFQNESQQILKIRGKLFLLIPGSGRIYELAIKNDSVNLVRVDKTFFSGFTFQSLSFNINDTIFSYGGYGFWHFNGGLRVYNPQFNEWMIRPTDNYIAKGIVHNEIGNFHFIDTSSKSLFISGSKYFPVPSKKQYIGINPDYNKLFKLDITSANWIELGEINDVWKKYYGYTSKGLLVRNENEYQILDPNSNRIFKIKGKTLDRLIHTPKSNEYQDIKLSFCVGNMLYVGDLNNWIDSVYINPVDIVDQGDLLYKKNNPLILLLSKINTTIFLLVLLNIFLLIFILRKWYKKTTSLDVEEYIPLEVLTDNGLGSDLLNVREKDLLLKIYNQSINNKVVSIQQINDFIGVGRRSLEVQKRSRTDIIQAINQKCIFLTKNTEPILLRSRSTSDRRMFDYFIKAERFSDIELFFKISESKSL
jgi:hypothetical protein